MPVTWDIVVIVIFMNAGAPHSYSAVLVPGVECNADVADAFFKQMAAHLEADSFSDDYDFLCLNAEEPMKAEVPKRRHVPGLNEAIAP